MSTVIAGLGLVTAVVAIGGCFMKEDYNSKQFRQAISAYPSLPLVPVTPPSMGAYADGGDDIERLHGAGDLY